MTVDRAISIAQLLWPILLLILARLYTAVRRIERTVERVERLAISDRRQWGILASHELAIADLKRKAG